MQYPIRTLEQLRPLLVGYRKQAGMSQAEVAALLGVTQQSYAKIEANPKNTNVERLITILRLLGAQIALMDRVDEAAAALPGTSIPRLPVAAPASRKKAVSEAPQKVRPASGKEELW